MKYRVTPRGILIQNNKVLFAAYNVQGLTIYALPGGKQEIGESLPTCLIREFKEELNLDIEVGTLVLVKEFIHEQSKVLGWEAGIHQVELIFEVSTTQVFDENKLGLELDKNMLGARFLSASEMLNKTYYPAQEPAWFFGEKPAIPYLF